MIQLSNAPFWWLRFTWMRKTVTHLLPTHASCLVTGPDYTATYPLDVPKLCIASTWMLMTDWIFQGCLILGFIPFEGKLQASHKFTGFYCQNTKFEIFLPTSSCLRTRTLQAGIRDNKCNPPARPMSFAAISDPTMRDRLGAMEAMRDSTKVRIWQQRIKCIQTLSDGREMMVGCNEPTVLHTYINVLRHIGCIAPTGIHKLCS